VCLATESQFQARIYQVFPTYAKLLYPQKPTAIKFSAVFSFLRPCGMASVYKAALHMGESSDSDSESNESSNTIGADSNGEDRSDSTSSQSAATDASQSEVTPGPVELRNRILMLTSRGVSHRWEFF